MRNYDKLNSFYTVPNVAALSGITGAKGWARLVEDGGAGKPVVYVWEVSSASWVIPSGDSGPALTDVITKGLATPPGSPSIGDRYIVATGGTGAWSGHDDDVTAWDGASWDFTTPFEGYAVYVEDEDIIYVWNGTAWVKLATRIDHGLLLGLGDDDHTQYHNDTRGDIRYYTKTLLDGGQLDNRYYTETELNANPVAAGAKIDKFVGTDHAIVRSDGIVGAVQDSGGSIDDSGNITANNLSGTNTGDEVQATESVLGIAELATQAETDAGTNDLTIVTPLKLATTTVLDARYYTETESDAAAGGAGAKINKVSGASAGNIAQLKADGEIEGAAGSVDSYVKIANNQKFLLKDSGASDIFYVTPLTPLGAIGAYLYGNATFPMAVFVVGCNAATGELARILFEAPKGTSVAGVGWNGTQLELFTDVQTGATDSKDILITIGETVDGDGGDLTLQTEIPTGTGARGDVIVDSTNWSVDASGNIDGNNVTSANISATESQAGTTEIATQTETDTGTNDDRYVTPLKLATTTVLDARYYTETELDGGQLDNRYYTETELNANPVAAGAKVDKFVGTDHAIVRSDGVVGAVQDTGIIVDDSDNIDTPGEIKLSNAVVDTNSKELILEANDGGVIQTGALQVLQGADPYLRISVPNDAGAKTAVLDIHDTLIALSNDNTVDLGAVASARLKNIYITGLFTAGGAITGSNLSGTNTGDEVAAAEGTAGIAELATQAETDAGTDDARIVTALKLRTTPDFRNYAAKTATPYLFVASDGTVSMNVAGAGVFNLPTVVGITGQVYTAVRYSALGPNTVSVVPNGVETIGGSASYSLTSYNQSVTFQSDGVSNWMLL